MIDREERIILEALRRELSSELGTFRQLLALATRKRAALVANKLDELHIIIEEENGLTNRGTEHRRIRDDLVRRLAQWRKLGASNISLTLMLDGVGEPLRGELERLRLELRGVLQSLSQMNDINQTLLRTALALVREVLSGVSGVDQNQGYDRRGLEGEQRGSGGLMNYSA